MAKYRITAPDGGTYEVSAPDTASEAEVLAYAQKNYTKAVEPTAPTKPKTFLDSATETARDLVAGGVRGAGSIGATILAPIDAAARAVGVQNDFIGRDDRREQMDAGLLPSLREYAARFGLTRERLAAAKPEVVVMHPGPMNEGVEIAPDVATDPRSVITNQVTNGVAVRMALLYLLAGAHGAGR